MSSTVQVKRPGSIDITCLLRTGFGDIVNEFSKRLPDIFISRICDFLQTDKISSIILASSTKLGHLSLQTRGYAGKAEDLVGYCVESLWRANQRSRSICYIRQWHIHVPACHGL